MIFSLLCFYDLQLSFNFREQKFFLGVYKGTVKRSLQEPHLDFLTLEDGANTLSRNVVKGLPLDAESADVMLELRVELSYVTNNVNLVCAIN
jgi:hypothetical protein